LDVADDDCWSVLGIGLRFGSFLEPLNDTESGSLEVVSLTQPPLILEALVHSALVPGAACP
jgi:hypothetical protein